MTHKPPRYVSLDALLKEDMPRRAYLIMPWLRAKEHAMVYSAPGVGKSFFALSMALAVAGGGKMLDKWSAAEAQPVLYVDGEMHIDDIRDRVQAFLPAMSAEESEKAKTNLLIMARSHQEAGTDFTDLAYADSRQALCDTVKTTGTQLVILDNLSTLATVQDENKASAFNDTIRFLLDLKQLGVACLLVHHSGKSAQTYRPMGKHDGISKKI